MKKEKDVNPMKDVKEPELGMALNASEKKEVTEYIQKINQAKLILAETYIQAVMLEKKKAELMETIASMDSVLAERVSGLAKSHGYDKDKDAAGWNLDLNTMTFKKRQ